MPSEKKNLGSLYPEHEELVDSFSKTTFLRNEKRRKSNDFVSPPSISTVEADQNKNFLKVDIHVEESPIKESPLKFASQKETFDEFCQSRPCFFRKKLKKAGKQNVPASKETFIRNIPLTFQFMFIKNQQILESLQKLIN